MGKGEENKDFFLMGVGKDIKLQGTLYTPVAFRLDFFFFPFNR